MRTAVMTLSLIGASSLGCGTMNEVMDVPVPREVRMHALGDGERVRLETSVGAFEVQEKNAELLRRMLAGEPVDVHFYAEGGE